MLNNFKQDVGTQKVRDDWSAEDSNTDPEVNKIQFADWVDQESTTPYVFEFSNTGFGPPATIAGYDGNKKMDQKEYTTVLLTPELTETARIYGRVGNGTYATNWFRIIVRDYAGTYKSDQTTFCFVQDSATSITLSGDAYNKEEETIAQYFNGIQLPRAIAQIYIYRFSGQLNLGPGANVVVYSGETPCD